MKWIDEYQVFLFDFDGLLVNTEEVHYLAYQLTCKEKGWVLPWSFPEYCSMAHYSAIALKEALEELYPELDWEPFYLRKTEIITRLVSEGQVHLMPGVEALLKELQAKNKKRCVVTHSKTVLIDPIRKQHPILNSIPVWITREYYSQPKPSSECYETAIAKLAAPEDAIIGFEDTPRGMHALMGTRAKAVMVSPISYPEIAELEKQGASYFRSFLVVNPN